MSKFCKYCGKQIDDDSNFCRFCGEDQNGLKAVNKINAEDEKKVKHFYFIIFYIFMIVTINSGAIMINNLYNLVKMGVLSKSEDINEWLTYKSISSRLILFKDSFYIFSLLALICLIASFLCYNSQKRSDSRFRIFFSLVTFIICIPSYIVISIFCSGSLNSNFDKFLVIFPAAAFLFFLLAFIDMIIGISKSS